MIQKHNKIDFSSPRSCRPIALLHVLGKGLGQLIARRMAWNIVPHKVIASQQLGAPPGFSAIDITTCLVHDVEKALNEELTISTLILDIKGTFDAIYLGRPI